MGKLIQQEVDCTKFFSDSTLDLTQLKKIIGTLKEKGSICVCKQPVSAVRIRQECFWYLLEEIECSDEFIKNIWREVFYCKRVDLIQSLKASQSLVPLPSNLLDYLYWLYIYYKQVGVDTCKGIFALLLTPALGQRIIDQSIVSVAMIEDFVLGFESAKQLFERRPDFPDDVLARALNDAFIRDNKALCQLLLGKMKQPAQVEVYAMCNVEYWSKEVEAEMMPILQDLIKKKMLKVTPRILFQLRKHQRIIHPYVMENLKVRLGAKMVEQYQEQIDIVLKRLLQDEQKECNLGCRDEYLIDLLTKILLGYHNTRIEKDQSGVLPSIEDYVSYYARGGHTTGWLSLYPAHDVPKQLLDLSPYGFNPEVYTKLLKITQQACKDENNSGAEQHAYKLTVLFGDLEAAQQYLAEYRARHPNRPQPIHDACLFEIPERGVWDIALWRKKVTEEIQDKQSQFKLIRLLSFAVKIEQHINGDFTPYAIVQDACKAEQEARSSEEERQAIIQHYKDELSEVLSQREGREIQLPKGNKFPMEYWKRFIALYKKHYPLAYGYFLSQHARNEKLLNQYRSLIRAQVAQDPDRLEYTVQDPTDPARHYTVSLKEQDKKNSRKVQVKKLTEKVVRAAIASHTENPGNPKDYDFSMFMRIFAQRRDLERVSYSELVDIILHSVYGDIDPKYHDFVFACARFGIPSHVLKKILEKIEAHPRLSDCLPEIEPIIDGDYRLEKMAPDDLMIALAGKETGCCQSIGGAGASCAKHALMSPFGGIYRIMSGSKWVAQAWGGITEDNTLVLDSIEWNAGFDSKRIMKLYQRFAERVLKEHPEITRVVFGAGGNTPREHGFKRQEMPADGYPSVIGYAENGYSDSKNERFILAEQKRPEKVPFDASTADVVIPKHGVSIRGRDTIIEVGAKKRHYLSLDSLLRNSFFKHHSKIQEALQAHEENPLFEEGTYKKRRALERARYGEDFIPFKMMEQILQEKFKDKSIALIMVDNDRQLLERKLKALDLKNGQSVCVLYVDDVHTQAGYIEKVNGKTRCMLLDSENDDFKGCEFLSSVQAAFPAASVCYTPPMLQKDYFSCSTFAMKALNYLAKYGHEVWEQAAIQEIKPGEVKALSPEETPATLLKLSQTPIYKQGTVPPEMEGKTVIEVSESQWNSVVSRRKQKSLGEYLKFYSCRPKGKGQGERNAAALTKKYKWLLKWEENERRREERSKEITQEITQEGRKYIESVH